MYFIYPNFQTYIQFPAKKIAVSTKILDQTFTTKNSINPADITTYIDFFLSWSSFRNSCMLCQAQKSSIKTAACHLPTRGYMRVQQYT